MKSRARAEVQAASREESPASPARACLRFTLPVPPSVNSYWKPVVSRGGRGARITLTKEARDYKQRVRLVLAGTAPLEGYVSVKLIVYFANHRRDLDGAEKLLLDAIQGFAYANDRQVVSKHTYKGLSRTQPRVEVTVSPVAA